MSLKIEKNNILNADKCVKFDGNKRNHANIRSSNNLINSIIN